MKNIDKMGVYVLLAHLIITVLIILVYLFTLYTGQGDETLKTILTVIIGYWFGSMGTQALRAPKHELPEKTETVTKTERGV